MSPREQLKARYPGANEENLRLFEEIYKQSFKYSKWDTEQELLKKVFRYIDVNGLAGNLRKDAGLPKGG